MFSSAEDIKEIPKSHPDHLVINVTTHAQDIKMLSVRIVCFGIPSEGFIREKCSSDVIRPN